MNEMVRAYIRNKGVERPVDKIIVHCAATPEGQPFTVEDIRRWHVLGNGWKDIGYHFVVYLDGSVHKGRPMSIVGAHCSGYNTGSIGVVYIGGCAADGKTPKDTRTIQQKAALIALLRELKRKWPQAKIYGHHDFNKHKACPSFDAKAEYANL